MGDSFRPYCCATVSWRCGRALPRSGVNILKARGAKGKARAGKRNTRQTGDLRTGGKPLRDTVSKQTSKQTIKRRSQYYTSVSGIACENEVFTGVCNIYSMHRRVCEVDTKQNNLVLHDLSRDGTCVSIDKTNQTKSPLRLMPSSQVA